MQKKWKWILALSLCLLFGLYVALYLTLSRTGYADADMYGMKGFYYFFPEENDAWRLRQQFCVTFFAPFNAIDRVLGYGRDPAFEPLWRLGPNQ